jgi:hypothetical protein
MTADRRIEPTIKTVVPGDRFGPHAYDLSAGAFPDYFDAEAVDWEWLRLPDGRMAVPHSAAFEDGNRTFSLRYLSGRKLNAHIQHIFFRPLIAPQRVVDTVEIQRTHIRRGREHVEFMALVRDGDGNLLMASQNDWVMNSSVGHEQDSPPEAYATPPAASLPPRGFSMPPSERALALQPGDELSALQRRAWLYEPPGGHGPDSVHGDEYARRVLGTRGAIVLGSTTLGYVNEVLGRALGPSWLERGSLDVRFTGAVVRNDPVTACARVTGVQRDAGGERLDFEVWVANEALDGQTSIAGTASYRLGPPSATA